MRDKKRIGRIMKLIETYWNKNPDQRLGQILINLGVAYDSFQHWTVEDDVWEKHLKSKK